MLLTVAAVGRLRDGAESALVERYAKMATSIGRSHALGPLTVQDILESRSQVVDLRRDDEGGRLIKVAGDADLLVLLDEAGSALTSRQFAERLRRWRDDGVKRAGFLIGGPDGHGEAAREAARLSLSLSPMTLPHGLARVILAEQIYRALTIIAGHPYHRA
ncbi:MAG: 23S rRNA (pseudouridine(1915)-N(3))-methyltransferase RlmH [Hyphomicrobiaceae bacterium]|nr:23S rRNA (pseudouridine(1915)-N(3))-methyltransferase RlmH [Hyphomicrobiaceae bacterium]